MCKTVWFFTYEAAHKAAIIHQRKMRRRSRSASGRHYEAYFCNDCGYYHFGVKK